MLVERTEPPSAAWARRSRVRSTCCEGPRSRRDLPWGTELGGGVEVAWGGGVGRWSGGGVEAAGRRRGGGASRTGEIGGGGGKCLREGRLEEGSLEVCAAQHRHAEAAEEGKPLAQPLGGRGGGVVAAARGLQQQRNRGGRGGRIRGERARPRESAREWPQLRPTGGRATRASHLCARACSPCALCCCRKAARAAATAWRMLPSASRSLAILGVVTSGQCSRLDPGPA